MTSNWERELEQARYARISGNEGRARVCARRAAGMVARDFLQSRGVPLRSTNALDALKTLMDFPGIAGDIRAAAEKLTLRVSEEFTLPGDIDLIEEAQILINGLEKHGRKL